ncbi:unnamed protein product [Onchocerca flexuosa]|uniref:Tr-type G domain-containing protein n=1 Tax=Onchocerca flexuosa TaxID=387005 RepID=A0A183HSM7_9BILA|nr:unnamed protein product [Onchocerca flexuosa]
MLTMATMRITALMNIYYNSTMLIIGRRYFSLSSAEKLIKTNRKKVVDLTAYPPVIYCMNLLNLFLIFEEKIRNFGIVAHVDHGKSTLADRLLELTGIVDKSTHDSQMLDKLQVERERGITVKAQSCTMFHKVL